MPTSQLNAGVAVQCPICSGTGRLHPDTLDCSEDSNGTKCVWISGVDCPSCGGLGKVIVELKNSLDLD